MSQNHPGDPLCDARYEFTSRNELHTSVPVYVTTTRVVRGAELGLVWPATRGRLIAGVRALSLSYAARASGYALGHGVCAAFQPKPRKQSLDKAMLGLRANA